MSTNANPWPAGDDGSSQPSQPQQPTPPDHEEHIDRKMIQHLLGRYGAKELSRLIRDEMAPREFL